MINNCEQRHGLNANEFNVNTKIGKISPGLYFTNDFMKQPDSEVMVNLIKNGLYEYLGINTEKEGDNLIKFDYINVNYTNNEIIAKLVSNAGVTYPPSKQSQFVSNFQDTQEKLSILLSCCITVIAIKDLGSSFLVPGSRGGGLAEVNTDDHFKPNCLGPMVKKIGVDLNEIGSFNSIPLTIYDIDNYISNRDLFHQANSINAWGNGGYTSQEALDAKRGRIKGDPEWNGDSYYWDLFRAVQSMVTTAEAGLSPGEPLLSEQELKDSLNLFWIYLHECLHIVYNTSNEPYVVRGVNEIRIIHNKPERLPSGYGLRYQNNNTPLIIFSKFLELEESETESISLRYCGALTYTP